MLTPELRALQDLCARLDGAGVEYMLTGSLAMSYHARPRMTRDIDIVVALEAAAAPKLAEILGAEYHVDVGLITEGFRLRHFMVINQAMASQRGKDAGARYLREFVEEMKASGFVARALERHKVQGAAVAPAGDAR